MRWPSVFRGRGCDVEQASIEFTDPRFIEKFSRFPFKHAVWDLLAVLPGQTLRTTGQIAIPEAATRSDYDLICVGSATWFFTTNMPLRSYLVSEAAKQVFDGKPFAAYVVCRRYWSVNLKEAKKLATKQGGRFVDAIHFQYEGRPDPVAAVAAELLRQGRDARPCARGEDPADQPEAGLRRPGTRVRQPARGRPSGQQQGCCRDGRLNRRASS